MENSFFPPLLGAFYQLLYCSSDITEYSALARDSGLGSRDSFATFIHVPACTSLHHEAKIGVCDRQLGSGVGLGSHGIPTKGMTAAQLRLLRVFTLEFIPDGVEQLQVTLVRPLLQGFDKRPT